MHGGQEYQLPRGGAANSDVDLPSKSQELPPEMGAVLSPTPTRHPALVSARGPPSRGRQKRSDGDRAVEATDLAGSQNEVNRLLDFAKKKNHLLQMVQSTPSDSIS
jgi:hypothetical protein